MKSKVNSSEYTISDDFWKQQVRGLLLIASLGNRDRFPLVRRNLPHFHDWDCIAYTYIAVPPEEQFFLSRDPDRRCRIETRVGWGWASLLNLTTPGVVAGYTHVFVLLDDVLLPHFSFSLPRLLNQMHQTRVPVISPTIAGASRLGLSPVVPRDLKPTVPWDCVHDVPVMEIFATLFTNAAWRCLSSLFNDDILHTQSGAVGWGYDLCYMAHCGMRGLSEQGVAISQLALHTEGPMSELATHVDTVRDLQRRIKRVMGLSDKWANNESHQLSQAYTRFHNLEKAFRSAADVFALYKEEIVRFQWESRNSLLPKTEGRRLSLYDGANNKVGLEQAKKRRCAAPYQRLKRATYGPLLRRVSDYVSDTYIITYAYD
mmetsp:Transcript_50539/g.107926  ORF Transcript_50539/g.107926 Transcript_50539/m.107926 type:complete len:373 (-) Transcript_50539:106-1224(-)